MKVFYTQKELAARWCCTEATVVNRRNKGLLPFFRLDESDNPLYPVEEIHRLEKEHTKTTKRKEFIRPPVERKCSVSVKPSNKEWRID